MTSWIRTPFRKGGSSGSAEKPLLYALEDGSITAQFNGYLYAHLYAKSAGKPLHVFDRSSAVSANTPILAETFQDLSGIQFESGLLAPATLLGRNSNRLSTFLNSQTFPTLRAGAAELFQWKDSITSEVTALRSHPGWPVAFDAGVLLATSSPASSLLRNVRGVSVSQYLEALRDLQKESGASELNIFVASETPGLLQEFKSKADRSWNLFTLFPANVMVSAHTPSTFARTTSKVRATAFRELVTELAILQDVPVLITVLANNTGKFLLLTTKHPEGFRSLDTNTFSAY